jgi:TRAP-type transport system periplasmic protein
MRLPRMKIKVRTGFVILGAAMLLAFAGCGRQDQDQTPRLRLAHIYDVGAPTHACGAAEFAREVAEADAGIEIRVFPGAVLGTEDELLEQIATGQIEMAIAGPSFLAAWHPPIGAFDAAYAFESAAHLMEFADSLLGQELWEELRQRHGIRVIDTWFYGARHITAKKPVRRPEDLKGMRLRMPNAQVWQATAEAMGASPIPISFTEVYMALRQGVADAQENPIPTIQAMKFHEVQSHINLTHHVYSSTQLLISERVWQRLSEKQRDTLVQAARAVRPIITECIERGDREILAQWRQSREMQVVEDVEIEAFRSRARERFLTGWPFSGHYGRIIERDY